MVQRLSPVDATFLFAECGSAPLHVGAVLVLGPPEGGGFDVRAFTALVERRLDLVPRLRQTVRTVPGRLGLPVWVDDARFDLSFHVRHLALPAPGTDVELRELVASVMETPLDRGRPLWELSVVEGLARGRTALLVKIHHAMADGLASMELAAALLDPSPQPREVAAAEWRAAAAPTDLALAAAAAVRSLTATRSALHSALDVARTVAGGTVPGIGRDVVAAARRAAAPAVPALRARTGTRRRHGVLRTTLADHRAVRRAHGGTVNDVVLAVVAGGLRRWLIGRGESPAADARVRAMVPVSLRGRDRAARANGISAHLVDLPVGESDPLRRLAHLRAAMDERKRRGPGAVDALTALAGLAPPLLHEVGARIAGRHCDRVYDVLVTNVPGPARPLYACGAPVLELVPVVPLGGGQAVAVGVASYAGDAHYGITVDPDAVPDLDDLVAALEQSLAELVVRSPRRVPDPPAAELLVAP